MRSTPDVRHAAALWRTGVIQCFSILPLKLIGQITTSRIIINQCATTNYYTASCRRKPLLEMKTHMMMSMILKLGHLVMVIIMVVMRMGIPTKRLPIMSRLLLLVLQMKCPVQKLFMSLLLQPRQQCPLSIELLLLRLWSLQVLTTPWLWNHSGGWKRVVPTINQVGFGTWFLFGM